MEVVDNRTPKSVTFSEIGPNEMFEYGKRKCFSERFN